MTIEEIQQIKIEAPSDAVYHQIRAHWDRVAKPLDGLGDFETAIARIGAIQRKEIPDIAKRAVVMMIADNGIVEEQVSQSGQEVTAAVAQAMGRCSSAVGKMAAVAGADTFPVDVGIATVDAIEGVRNEKIAYGTANFRMEQAMTKEQAEKAINVGIKLVKELLNKDYTIIATGEMGIGNTTTATALSAALLHIWDRRMPGRGAGLSDEGLRRKEQVISEAIDKYDLLTANPFEALCAVGGFDIAALCGVFLGGAIYHVPIVIDGLISATAAYLAQCILPGASAYFIASHWGREPVLPMLFSKMQLKPFILGNMALGEGTGAVMLFPLLDMAMALYANGEKFGEMAVGQYHRNGDVEPK